MATETRSDHEAAELIRKLFGERLVTTRKEKGFDTQEKLATALGVDRSVISKWESGERLPRLEQQVSLCRVLDVPHSSLFSVEVTA